MICNQSKRVTRILTIEEKSRCANFFMILIEIDQQVDVTRRRSCSASLAQPGKKAAANKRRSLIKKQ